MDILLFLFGNWCCAIAAGIVLFHYIKRGTSGGDSDNDMMISSDLGIMLCISSFVRMYWSLSPPPIWSDEHWMVQWVAIGDMVASVLLWSLVVIVSTRNAWKASMGAQDRYVKPTVYGGEKTGKLAKIINWYVLTVIAASIGGMMTFVLPTLHTHGAWPLVDFAVIFNMVLDGMAMVPQVILVASKSEKPVAAQAHHFVGLLCLGRLLRTIFWIWLVLHPESGHAVWTFVIPDLLHTIIMGDYLYHWLSKVGRDNVVPLISAVRARLSV